MRESGLASAATKSGWISPARLAAPGAMTLFCFPYAGGGASFYRGWPSRAPLSICPVQLPGREERAAEPAFDAMDGVVEAAADALGPHLDQPYAFFGHSMGAMIAFELAHLLRERRAPAPRHLFVSGTPSPPRAARMTPLHHLPDEQLIERIRDFGGMPDQILASRELVALFLPRFRSDFTITGTYRYTDKPPLTCPITVLGGAADPVTTMEELEEWREFTVARCEVELFAGGHFFLAAASDAVVSRLVRSLKRSS